MCANIDPTGADEGAGRLAVRPSFRARDLPSDPAGSGAIVRADVERVNGVYQGACFPFWGKGLLGPLCLAFDPRGHLYVGGITEPGWMAQPDRGALSEMVEFARQTGAARSLTNVEYRVLDAEQLDLPHASVDGVVCRFGYMLMAEPAAALRETRRVLRDGGTLSFTVWMGPERNPWAALPPLTLVERGHLPPPEPGTPGIFALADPTRIRELVTQAGFGEPELEEIAFEFRYADADELWDSLVRLAGGLARAGIAAARSRQRRQL